MTTNPDPIETVVRRVADGLGWEMVCHGEPSRIYLPDHCVLFNSMDGADLIILAAYAEAELYKRGMRIDISDGTIKRRALVSSSGANPDNSVGVYFGVDDPRFNPADPVSRAEAVLRAVDEVIGGGG